MLCGVTEIEIVLDQASLKYSLGFATFYKLLIPQVSQSDCSGVGGKKSRRAFCSDKQGIYETTAEQAVWRRARKSYEIPKKKMLFLTLPCSSKVTVSLALASSSPCRLVSY